MRAYFEDTYILLLGVEYLYYQAKSGTTSPSE